MFDFLAGNHQTEEEAKANLGRQKRLLAAQMERRKREGTISNERYARDQAALGVKLDSVKGGYLSGFAEGLGDGKQNVNNAFWSGVGNALKLIPTPVWLIAGVGVLLYLGGGAVLLKKAKGVLAK